MTKFKKMKFLDLRYFILFMWGLVMIACISIIFIIAPLSKHQIYQLNSLIILQTSIIQAILAVIIVGILIYLLNKFKKIYLFKKLLDKEKG
jgi:uncharacterized membrane protein